MNSRGALVLCAALSAACLCACSRSPTQASAAQPEELVLHVYNWADYIGFDTVARFERQTGIRVIYDLFDSNETLEGKLLIGDSGYDIVSTSMEHYARQIRSGLYEPLDKGQLPNWKNLDPAVLAIQAQADPGNRYAAPYLHSMNGFAYNAPLVHARMPDAPVDSLDMLFKPQVVARFADCGVSFLDSPIDVIQLALKYLKRDPNSSRIEDLQAAEQLIMSVRRYIRVFDSSDYVEQLASRELCVAMGWSGDLSLAVLKSRAAGLDLHLMFTIPREGSNIAYNALLIPAGAPHPQAAHKFINFILEPRVVADITNDLHYGNDNLAARSFVNPEILKDPAIYPPPELRARLYLPAEYDIAFQRQVTRTWTRIKNGL
jgi:putrescine transport system substrate-binding protein